VTFDVLRAVTAIFSLFGRRKSGKMRSNVTETTAAFFFYRTQESKRILQIASTHLQITRRDVAEDSALDNECMSDKNVYRLETFAILCSYAVCIVSCSLGFRVQLFKKCTHTAAEA
jgi:hypothetical protein